MVVSSPISFHAVRRRKKEEGRRKKEEGRNKNAHLATFLAICI
ncbi:hypothetical protein QUA20_12665 [Microcoleus sp. Pol7_A1]